MAALFAGAAFWSGNGPLAQVLGMVGGTLIALVVAIYVIIWVFGQNNKRAQATISEFVAHDAAPCFVTDEDGELWYVNEAGKTKFRGDALTLSGLLGDVFANPLAVVQRLRKRADKTGAAREDIVTRRGNVRLSTHRLSRGQYLWRIEAIGERMAVASANDSSFLPVVSVGRNGTVLFMNDAARDLVGERVKNIDRLFEDGAPRTGDINLVRTVDGPRKCFLAERSLAATRRELILAPATEAAEVINPQGGEADLSTPGWKDVEALPVPMLKVATTGEVLLSNRLARDLLGRGDCTGLHLATLMEGLGRSLTDWLTEVAAGRETHSSEFLRVSREDREVFVQVMLKRAMDANGTALIAVLNDATELKTLEAQFVQSQKMQAIGQLAGGVAHDFNNLLTAISGHCDLLLLRHDAGDPGYNDLVQINQNANRAAALVSQLLAFSRKQTLRLEVLDLRDTLSDLTHLLNRLVGETVRLTLDHEQGLHALRADKRQLEQVVMNLVVNARDAMPSGGDISLRTRNVTYDGTVKRDRATLAAGDYVSVEICDQGTGIPADKLQKIFEPFYTTKRTGEGTGLGLSTAYGIVKQSGGFIFADSTPGKGSTFTLLFPAFAPDDQSETAKPGDVHILGENDCASEVDAPREPLGIGGEEALELGVKQSRDAPNDSSDVGEGVAATPKRDEVILLVEDEAPVRAFASRALRLKGYTVLEAGSAEEALEALEETDLVVDIFVTDVVMPGMDGPSWVRKALEVRPEVRVVFVSGYAEDAFGEGKTEIPNSVFLPKPFSLTELTETIRQQLH
ncbi:ATP-binding protein [Rhodobacteraceae bacterium D3-12]|nr:ATP-binding protein [Rhodobacteraceae bacterium D3-12]